MKISSKKKKKKKKKNKFKKKKKNLKKKKNQKKKKKKKRKKGRLRKKEARIFIVEPLPPHLYKAGGLSFQNFQKIGGCLIFPIKREG